MKPAEKKARTLLLTDSEINGLRVAWRGGVDHQTSSGGHSMAHDARTGLVQLVAYGNTMALRDGKSDFYQPVVTLAGGRKGQYTDLFARVLEVYEPDENAGYWLCVYGRPRYHVFSHPEKLGFVPKDVKIEILTEIRRAEKEVELCEN